MSAISTSGPRAQPAAWLIVLLGLLTALDAMSIDIYMPAVPVIQHDFGTTALQLQVAFTSFLLGIVVGQLCWGPISDRYGRRGPMLAGLCCYVAGSALAMAAPDLGTFLIARFVQAIGASAGLVIARAMVDDLWDAGDTPRIYTLLMQILGVTALISPVIGGLLLLSGAWRPIFGVLLAVGCAGLVACMLRLPESLPHERRASPGIRDLRLAYAALLGNRLYLGATLAGAFTAGTMFVLLATAAFYFVDGAGWSPTAYGLFYGFTALVFIGACQINLWALARWSAARITLLALVAQLVLTAALLVLFAAGADSAGLVALLMTALMSIVGFVWGNATAVAMAATSGHAGVASSLVGVTQFLAGAVLAPLATLGADLGVSLSLTMVAASGAALACWRLVDRSSPAAIPA